MEKIELLFIHGFGGCPADWDEIVANLGTKYSFRFVDLKNVPFDAGMDWNLFVSRLQAELKGYENSVLCGYSLGGRIALHLVARKPVRGLVLVSAGFGEENLEARALRRQRDRDWAACLQADPEDFWLRWYDQELFSSVKSVEAARRERWFSSRFLWNNELLANHLVSLSPAEQNWMLPVLSAENSPPVLYLAGEKDKKYVALSRRVKNESGSVQVEIVPGSGHALPLEAPEACAQAIKKFLEKLG